MGEPILSRSYSFENSLNMLDSLTLQELSRGQAKNGHDPAIIDTG